MSARQVGLKLDLERDVLLLSERFGRAVHAGNHFLHRIVGEFERKLTGLDLGKIEYVIDQTQEVLAVALNSVDHLAHLRGRLAIDVVEDELGVTEHGVERRT